MTHITSTEINFEGKNVIVAIQYRMSLFGWPKIESIRYGSRELHFVLDDTEFSKVRKAVAKAVAELKMFKA